MAEMLAGKTRIKGRLQWVDDHITRWVGNKLWLKPHWEYWMGKAHNQGQSQSIEPLQQERSNVDTPDSAKRNIGPNSPMISLSQPPYISEISIKGDPSPFENLESVEHYTHTDVNTTFEDGLLEVGLEDYVARDKYPLPRTEDREEYHGDRHYDWWLSGLKDFLCVKQALGRHGGKLDTGDQLLELGCASGRVLRHFAIQSKGLQVWGADIKLRHVEWIRKFLPPSINIFHNSVLPHLPIEDNSLSLVCAFSVFTHIDDFELAWIAEIRRILKPGGFAYLTIHSENTWKQMEPDWPLYSAILSLRDHITEYDVTPDFLAGPFPADKTVFWWNIAKVYNCSVFQSTDYIRNAWGRFLEIKEIIPRGHIYQDVVLLQKG
jgi:SAM-dependent methyltransferase